MTYDGGGTEDWRATPTPDKSFRTSGPATASRYLAEREVGARSATNSQFSNPSEDYMLELANDIPDAISCERPFVRILRNATAACVLLLASNISLAMPSRDTDAENEPPTQKIELRILTESAKILEQIKGSVCGTGQFYAGKVDDPIFVTPLYKPTCIIVATPPSQR